MAKLSKVLLKLRVFMRTPLTLSSWFSKLYYSVKPVIQNLLAKQEMRVRSLGHEDPLQEGTYSCLGNPMGRGTWQAIVHRVAQSHARLGDLTTQKATLSESYITGPYHPGFCFYMTIILTLWLQLSWRVYTTSSKGGKFLYLMWNCYP